MIEIKKLYIVLGTGGSRKDFVTGWFGKLPNFVDTRWYIDLQSGASYSDVHNLKIIDSSPEYTFINELSAMDICLNDDAVLNLAVNCHGLNLERNLEGLSKDQYEILNINVDVNLNDIYWQNFVKNFLHYNTSIDSLRDGNYLNKDILKYIDSSGETHAEIISNFFPVKDPDFKSKILLHTYDNSLMTQFQYDELFIPGGSKTLCDRLNISAPDNVHSYWDTMLPFAEPPDEVDFLGKIWKKSDYIK